MNRLAFTLADVEALDRFFAAARPNEAGAFFLVTEASTPSGLRLVARDPYFPPDTAWTETDRHRLVPSGQLISQVVSRAVAANAGLLFVHSHPDSRHPTGFSWVDDQALDALSRTLVDLIDGPFVAAVVGPKGWVARRYQGDAWESIERITAPGHGIRILDPLPDPQAMDADLDDRQILALGDLNARLRTLDVAVVGVGGLGSPLAEILVRLGVRGLTIIDPDHLDTQSNLRRVFGAKSSQLAGHPYKVDVVAEHCGGIGLPTNIIAIPGDVRREDVFPHLLDADVVFSATDSQSSRAVMNAASYAFHLPVIDCGCRISRREPGGLAGLLSEVRFIAPGLPCLFCRRTLSPDAIRAEILPAAERRALHKEGYVVGSDAPEPSACALTVLGAGMMASSLLAYLSSESEILNGGYLLDALMEEIPRAASAVRCTDDCLSMRGVGRGLQASLGLLPR